MTSPIITEAVRALVDRRDLTRIEAAAAMEAIMTGAATGAQIGAFLTALRMKGEAPSEVVGAARWVLSLGRLTLSHELARTVLYEQIFRALSIGAGMSYHREP